MGKGCAPGPRGATATVHNTRPVTAQIQHSIWCRHKEIASATVASTMQISVKHNDLQNNVTINIQRVVKKRHFGQEISQ